MNLNDLVALLGFQLAGELLHRVAHLPLSGPLIGMTLLFLFLVARGGPSPGLQGTARALLAYLALLFVPAGVGVITHLHLIAAYWLPILVATIGGAAAALLAGAATMRLAERLAERIARQAPSATPAAPLHPPLGDTPGATALDGHPR
jgi:holin-like protein